MRRQNDFLRMIGILICGMFLLITTTACSASSPVEGMWTDTDSSGYGITMGIDGENGYLQYLGATFVCSVDSDEKIITVKGFANDGSDVDYTFDFVDEKLVLNTDNPLVYLEKTISLVNDEEAEIYKTKEIDGHWDYVGDQDLHASIDGDKGVFTLTPADTGYDYACTVDKANETITVNDFDWGGGTVEYSYKMINGRLLLFSDNNKTYFARFVMEPTNNDGNNKDTDGEEITETEGDTSLGDWNQLSNDYYVVGDDIDSGIYDFAPVEDEDSFSVIIFDNMDYFEQSPYSTSEKKAKDDFYKHNRSVYGDEIEKGISLKKGNVLYVDYQGVLYDKQ